MINPLLQNAGEAWVPFRPIGKLVEDQQRGECLLGQQTEELAPGPGNHVSEHGECIAELFGHMEELLLGGPLNRLMVDAIEQPTGFLKQGGLPDTATPGDVPKPALTDVTPNL